MAKEVAIGKRAKISEAQQNMILSVLVAAIFLGAAVSLTVHFIQAISFNAKVISAQDKSIADYSSVIKRTGICRAPKGNVYTSDEIDKCDPNDIKTSEIPGTLRANIIQNLASNPALNSVAKENTSVCTNSDTNKSYTYKELMKTYNDAINSKNTKDIEAATQLVKSCSALRIIPDALPAFRNEEALLASVDKLFKLSGWNPESLSPSNSAGTASSTKGLNAMSINLSIEAAASTTMNVLNNIERSIREFDIERATIEWGSDDTLILQAKANAYYMDTSTIKETELTIKPEGSKK